MLQKAQSPLCTAILSRDFIDPTSSVLLKMPVLVKSARLTTVGTWGLFTHWTKRKQQQGIFPSQHSLPALFLLPNFCTKAVFWSSNQQLLLLNAVKIDNLFHSSKQDQDSKTHFTPMRFPVKWQLHSADFHCPDQDLQTHFMQGTVWTPDITESLTISLGCHRNPGLGGAWPKVVICLSSTCALGKKKRNSRRKTKTRG